MEEQYPSNLILRVHLRVIHSPQDPAAYRTIILDYSGERSGDESQDRNVSIVFTGHKFNPQVSILGVYIRVAEDLKSSAVKNAIKSSTIYYGVYKRPPMSIDFDSISHDDLAMTFWDESLNQLRFSSYVPHRKDAIKFEKETGRKIDSFKSIYEIAAAPQTNTFVGASSVDLYYYTDPVDFLREPIFGSNSAYTEDSVTFHVSIALKSVAVAIATEISSDRARMVERVFFRSSRKIPRREPYYYPRNIDEEKITKFSNLVPSLSKISYYSAVAKGPRINLRAMFRSLKLSGESDTILAAVSYAQLYGIFNGTPRVNEDSEEMRVSKAVISRLSDIQSSRVYGKFKVSKSKDALETITGHLARYASLHPSETDTKDQVSQILKLSILAKDLLDQQIFDSIGMMSIYIYDTGYVQVEFIDDREEQIYTDIENMYNILQAKAEEFIFDSSVTYVEDFIPETRDENSTLPELRFEIAKVNLQVTRVAYNADEILSHGPFMKANDNTYVYMRSSDYMNAVAKRLATQKAALVISRYGSDVTSDDFPLRKMLSKSEKGELTESIITQAEIYYGQKLSKTRSADTSISWTPVIRVTGRKHNHVHYRMFIEDLFTETMIWNVTKDLESSTAVLFITEFKTEDAVLEAIQKLYSDNPYWALKSVDPSIFAYTNKIFGTSTGYAMLCPKPVIPLVDDPKAESLLMKILKKSDADDSALNILEFRGRKYTCVDEDQKFIYPKKRTVFTDVSGKDLVVVCCSKDPDSDESPDSYEDDDLPKDSITRKKTSVGSTQLPPASDNILNEYGASTKTREFMFVRFGPKKRTSQIQPKNPRTFDENVGLIGIGPGTRDFVSERVLSSLIEAFEYKDKTQSIRERLAEYADNKYQKDMFIRDARIIIDEVLSVAAKRGTFIRAGCNIIVISESKYEKTKILLRSFSPRGFFDPSLNTFLFSEAFDEPFEDVLNRVPGQLSRFLTFTPIYVIKQKETGKFDYKKPFARSYVPDAIINKYSKVKADDWDYGLYFLTSKVIAADKRDNSVSGHLVSFENDVLVSGASGIPLYVIVNGLDSTKQIIRGDVILPIERESFSLSGSRKTQVIPIRDAKLPTLETMISSISEYNLAVSSVVVDTEDAVIHGVILNSGIYVPIEYEPLDIDKLGDYMLNESVLYEPDHLHVERTNSPRDNIIDYVSKGIVELFKDFIKSMVYVAASKEARDTEQELKSKEGIRKFAEKFVAEKTRVVAAFSSNITNTMKDLSSVRTYVSRISSLLGLNLPVPLSDKDAKIPIPDTLFREQLVSYIVSRATSIDTPSKFSSGEIEIYSQDVYETSSKGKSISDRLYEDSIYINGKNFEEAVIATFSGPRRMSIIESSYF